MAPPRRSRLAPGGAGIEPLPTTVEAKIASAISAKIRVNAEKNGHNPELVDAMIYQDKPFKLGDKVLNEKSPLTLTCNVAAEKVGDPPKPLLSLGTVDSLDALLKELGYAGAQVKTITPTGAEKLGTWINAISPILLIIGIIGIYIEFKTPGVILPGVMAVLAFLLYFLGGYVAGLSGMEWVIVFVVGLALVISEFFVHPGTILPGLVGMILIFIALVMAMVDMYPGTPALPTLPQIKLPVQQPHHRAGRLRWSSWRSWRAFCPRPRFIARWFRKAPAAMVSVRGATAGAGRARRPAGRGHFQSAPRRQGPVRRRHPGRHHPG